MEFEELEFDDDLEEKAAVVIEELDFNDASSESPAQPEDETGDALVTEETAKEIFTVSKGTVQVKKTVYRQ